LNRYKIGRHKGSIDALVKRYITAIPDVRIDFFMEGIGHLEQTIHKMLDGYRINNVHGHKSEWFCCPLEEIFDTIHRALDISNSIIRNAKHIALQRHRDSKSFNTLFGRACIADIHKKWNRLKYTSSMITSLFSDISRCYAMISGTTLYAVYGMYGIYIMDRESFTNMMK
jgi:hypothetical protein